MPPLSLAASCRIGKCLQGISSSQHNARLPGCPPVLDPSSLILHSLVSSSASSSRILSILSSFSSSHWEHRSKLNSLSLTQVEVLCLLLKSWQMYPQYAGGGQWFSLFSWAMHSSKHRRVQLGHFSLTLLVQPLLAFGIETLALNPF